MKNESEWKYDVIIIDVPHFAYKDLSIPKNKEIVNLWGIIKRTD